MYIIHTVFFFIKRAEHPPLKPFKITHHSIREFARNLCIFHHILFFFIIYSYIHILNFTSSRLMKRNHKVRRQSVNILAKLYSRRVYAIYVPRVNFNPTKSDVQIFMNIDENIFDEMNYYYIVYRWSSLCVKTNAQTFSSYYGV